MTTIQVHHLNIDRPGYTHVADVDVPDGVKNRQLELEFAWRWTQNIEGSWSKPDNPDHNSRVTVVAPVGDRGLRSSMMGDRFIREGECFDAAGIGFVRCRDRDDEPEQHNDDRGERGAWSRFK